MNRYIFLTCFFFLGWSLMGVSKEDLVIPEAPKEDMVEYDEEGKVLGVRILEKNTTVYLESKVDIYVPLEIISDIDIEALVIDESQVKIPFEIELNRKPERENYFKLKYSEREIDIDKDGKIDTYIYSSPYVNNKIEKNNIVYIDGRNITKEGDYEKIVYMTLEVTE
ncbi:MAG: hypothetical protein ACRC1R_04980 [Cetobacterium sp.]|uniref:hypothetical protein n=1 Tax=Cetobacterium sp. TaxID=2071632 RepID=UPI003F32DD58